MMTRRAREQALRILFEADSRELPVDEALLRETLGGAIDEYGVAIVEGVASRRDQLDEILNESAENWTVRRMPIVDRNVLRMAAWELTSGSTPTGVVINEAIEIARKFSTEESASFVNGVLSRVADRAQAGDAEVGEPDASEPDASDADASEPDTSDADVGEPDASEPDAGEVVE